MRKKSRSSVVISEARARTRNLYPLLSPPDFEEALLVNDSQMAAQKSNVSLAIKEGVRFRHHKSSVKNKEETRPVKAEQNVCEIQSLEDCKKAFETIIAKNKKYGQVLQTIKEVYEQHFEKPQQPVQEINLWEKLNKKAEESKKMVSKKLGNSRSNSSLINAKSFHSLSKCLKIKDSGSTFDTIVTSPVNGVPELSLGLIPKSDFHEEFMANYENFSESWRQLSKEIRK